MITAHPGSLDTDRGGTVASGKRGTTHHLTLTLTLRITFERLRGAKTM